MYSVGVTRTSIKRAPVVDDNNVVLFLDNLCAIASCVYFAI